MCNLNIIIKTKKIQNIVGFVQSVTSASFKHNNHGDGVFLSDGKNNILFKSIKKINYIDFYKSINKSKYILTHQRIATSGYGEKFTQPFENDEFVILHNGILAKYDVNDNSDTYNFFVEFYELFKKIDIEDRQRKIYTIVKQLLDGKQGSFSIALFDKKTQVLYYFKNDTTSINFFRSKSMLYITTSYENGVFLDMINTKFKKFNVRDYAIYSILINDNNKIEIKHIGDIEKPKVEKVRRKNKIYDYYDWAFNDKEYNEKTDWWEYM